MPLVGSSPLPKKYKFDEFVKIAKHIHSAGLSAPEVYAYDTEHGFALIEDFGEDTFTR